MAEKGQIPLPVANWSHCCHVCSVGSKMAIVWPDFHSSSVPGHIPFSSTMSELLHQCPDCHLHFKWLSTHSPFCTALSSDESSCSVGPSGHRLMRSDGSELLHNDKFPLVDDDKPQLNGPAEHDDSLEPREVQNGEWVDNRLKCKWQSGHWHLRC